MEQERNPRKRRNQMQAAPAANEASIDRGGNPQDPVVLLPPEVSLLIIQGTMPSDGDPSSQLLELACVSQKWEQFIFSASTLWCNIYIEWDKEDLLATVALFAHFSGTARLNFFIGDDRGAEWNGIVDILRPLRHRVINLIFLGTRFPPNVTQPSSLFFRAASVVFAYLSPFDNLRGIHFEPPVASGILSFRVLDLPPDALLTSEAVLDLSEAIIDGKCGSLFSKVTIHDHLADIASMLHLLTSVTMLKLINTSVGEIEDFPTPFSTGLLPRLTHLVYFQEYCVTLKQLLQLTAAQLTFISLRLPLDKMTETVDLLQDIVNLEDLVLHIYKSYEPIPPSMTPSNVTIHSMRKLSLQGYNLIADKDASKYLMQLLRSLFRLYPNVDWLTSAGIYMSINGSFMEMLGGLRFLSIACWKGSSLDFQTTRLINLTELAVCDAGHLLKYLDLPNLLALRVSGLEWYNQFDIWNSPHLRKIKAVARRGYQLSGTLDTAYYPELHSLHVEADMQNTFGLSPLSRVVKITLHNRLHGDYPGNRLCTSLIYEPAQWPMLEELHFNRFVDWDILFTMLERRNREVDRVERRNYDGERVRRIHTVTLPFVPFDLRVPLALLLGGNEAIWSSIIDLSMLETREVISDLSIPGCFLCLKNMRPGCTKAVIPRNMVFTSSPVYIVDHTVSRYTVSEDVLTWFKRHTSNNTKWKRFLREHYELSDPCRAGLCDRYQPTNQMGSMREQSYGQP